MSDPNAMVAKAKSVVATALFSCLKPGDEIVAVVTDESGSFVGVHSNADFDRCQQLLQCALAPPKPPVLKLAPVEHDRTLSPLALRVAEATACSPSMKTGDFWKLSTKVTAIVECNNLDKPQPGVVPSGATNLPTGWQLAYVGETSIYFTVDHAPTDAELDRVRQQLIDCHAILVPTLA